MMKIRMGFVSNSSSSSYTCGVCDTTESGWDLGLQEAGMKSCINGHTFCEKHASDFTLTVDAMKDALLEQWYYTSGGGMELRGQIAAATTVLELDSIVGDLDDALDELTTYEVPPQFCPICSFGKVHERDAFLYLLKVAGRDEADLLAELKERFSGYEEMKLWLKE
jgi:hypothetical protein